MKDGLEALTDEVLMTRIADEDEDSFVILMERHKDRVYGTVARMIGGAGPDSEDIAQEVFLRVWKAAPKYRSDSKFTTWLMTILRNLVFTHSARIKRRAMISADAVMDGHGESFLHQQADSQGKQPDHEMERKELGRAIERASSHLSESQRMIVHLRQYEEMEFGEIAKVMKMKTGAVKSLMFRARDILKEKLSKNIGVSF